eukprot:TRINITY_DN719_c0_g1_i1.p1 TRINITY_DN719_c0_g1~~TRINITY_DN719_c0_g1_i1.p1  ORF type:complete len:529 (+),score=105.02 TRINITY_DN719_c0_g1_i1:66-1652(+)
MIAKTIVLLLISAVLLSKTENCKIMDLYTQTLTPDGCGPVFEGDLSINRNNLVRTSIEFLSVITHVTGHLEVKNTLLDSFHGLRNIVSVGDFSIYNCSKIVDLSGINLETVQGFISIYRNNILQNISALEKLTHAPSDLTISGNKKLSTFTGLHNIATIEGYLKLESVKTSNFSGLDSLETVGGDLYLDDLDYAVSFGGFKKLKTVLGKVMMRNSYKMKNLENFDSLEYIGGNLEFLDCRNMENFEGMSNLKFIGGDLHVSNSFYLDHYTGMYNLMSIGGSIILNQDIFGEVVNKTVNPFPSLVRVGGQIQLCEDCCEDWNSFYMNSSSCAFYNPCDDPFELCDGTCLLSGDGNNVCIKSSGNCTGDNIFEYECESCDERYYSEYCSEECLCSENSFCDEGITGGGECTCFENYYGLHCNGNCNCSGNGFCDDGTSGSGECTCFDQYYGDHCQYERANTIVDQGSSNDGDDDSSSEVVNTIQTEGETDDETDNETGVASTVDTSKGVIGASSGYMVVFNVLGLIVWFI